MTPLRTFLLLPPLVLAAVAARAQAPCALPDDTPDTPALSAPVSAGAVLARVFERMSDRDLFHFSAQPDHAYTLRVTPVPGGGVVDGELHVYQSDGRTLLGRASSTGSRTYAEIQVPAAGYARRLYLDARPFAEYSQGAYSLSVLATPPPDGDGDGLPTAWETANGLNDADPGSASPFTNGPSGDPDGDGLTNREEWLAGTHPRSASSVLRILNLGFGVSPDGTLSWPAPRNARYAVYRGETPLAPAWSLLGTHFQADDSGTALYVDPDAGSFPGRLYKVEFLY